MTTQDFVTNVSRTFHGTHQNTTVRATLPSALNVINASSVGKLVQLVTASRLTLNHEGRVDPMKDECHYQMKHEARLVFTDPDDGKGLVAVVSA